VSLMSRCEGMRNAERQHTQEHLPETRVQRTPFGTCLRHLFDPELFLCAYGKIYRNNGATTKGSTEETVDGMSLRCIHNIIDSLKGERYMWTPVRRTEIPKANGKRRRWAFRRGATSSYRKHCGHSWSHTTNSDSATAHTASGLPRVPLRPSGDPEDMDGHDMVHRG